MFQVKLKNTVLGKTYLGNNTCLFWQLQRQGTIFAQTFENQNTSVSDRVMNQPLARDY